MTPPRGHHQCVNSKFYPCCKCFICEGFSVFVLLCLQMARVWRLCKGWNDVCLTNMSFISYSPIPMTSTCSFSYKLYSNTYFIFLEPQRFIHIWKISLISSWRGWCITSIHCRIDATHKQCKCLEDEKSFHDFWEKLIFITRWQRRYNYVRRVCFFDT